MLHVTGRAYPAFERDESVDTHPNQFFVLRLQEVGSVSYAFEDSRGFDGTEERNPEEAVFVCIIQSSLRQTGAICDILANRWCNFRVVTCSHCIYLYHRELLAQFRFFCFPMTVTKALTSSESSEKSPISSTSVKILSVTEL